MNIMSEKKTKRRIRLAIAAVLTTFAFLMSHHLAWVALAQIAEEPPAATPAPEELVATRTPMPTATADWIEREVLDLAAQAGLATTRFLGLGAGDWVNLGASLIIVFVGYLLGTWLIGNLLPQLYLRTPTLFDDHILELAGPGLRWLIVILFLQYATTRLTFVDADVKLLLSDVYFIVTVVLGLRIFSNLLTFTDTWYGRGSSQATRERGLAPAITLLVRFGRLLLIIVGGAILLSHFGVNVTAITAVLGIGALAISLAARDTIADAIAGFIILIDRPFRIGDRIAIQAASTWGDVIEIGLRTTRIRTLDNRMVIVPNSVIVANHIVNYSYPDPRYRVETKISIAYGADIEQAKQVIRGAVCGVKGVLTNEPVDVLYLERGASAMIFHVRWWIESYVEVYHVTDRVFIALEAAIDATGIGSGYPKQDLILQVSPETAAQISTGVAQLTGWKGTLPRPPA